MALTGYKIPSQVEILELRVTPDASDHGISERIPRASLSDLEHTHQSEYYVG